LPGPAAIYLRWYLRWRRNSQTCLLATAACATPRGSQFGRAVRRVPTTLGTLWRGCGLAILPSTAPRIADQPETGQNGDSVPLPSFRRAVVWGCLKPI